MLHSQHPSHCPQSLGGPQRNNPFSLFSSDFAAWTPNSKSQKKTRSRLNQQLTVDADGHGVVHALPERLVLGLADEHAAVVLGLDVHLQQADRHVPAKVPGLARKICFHSTGHNFIDNFHKTLPTGCPISSWTWDGLILILVFNHFAQVPQQHLSNLHHTQLKSAQSSPIVHL